MKDTYVIYICASNFEKKLRRASNSLNAVEDIAFVNLMNPVKVITFVNPVNPFKE